MQQGADFANLLISATVVIVFVGAIWYLVRKANTKKLTVGQHLNTIFMREESTFLIILIAGMNIMEALVAASIHPIGTGQINPVARFAMHLMFGFAGAYCAITAPKKIMEFFKDWKYFFRVTDVKNPKNNRPSKPLIPIIDILLGSGLLFISIALPYWNVNIMATGLGETTEFYIACLQLQPWFHNSSVGIADSNYIASEHMSMIMLASFTALKAHVFIAGLDGLYALYERNKYDLDVLDEKRNIEAYSGTTDDKKASTNVDDKINKKAEEKKPADEKDKQKSSQLTYILNFLDIKNQDDRHGYYEKAIKVIAENVGPVGANISGQLMEMYNKAQLFNTETAKSAEFSSDDIKRKRDEMKEDIREFFRTSPKDGGFGFDVGK